MVILPYHLHLHPWVCLFIQAYTQIKQNPTWLWIPILLINCIYHIRYRDHWCAPALKDSVLTKFRSVGQKEKRGGGWGDILICIWMAKGSRKWNQTRGTRDKTLRHGHTFLWTELALVLVAVPEIPTRRSGRIHRGGITRVALDSHPHRKARLPQVKRGGHVWRPNVWSHTRRSRYTGQLFF